MKIVADPNIPFLREAFGALGQLCLVPGREIAARHLRDADVLLVRSVTPVSPALLEGSRVKFVATATIGVDHVDLAHLRQRGIGFASAHGSNATSVAEYVVAALLELAGRRGFRLQDRALGVVGVGEVGRRVARAGRALGMRVLENDPPRQRTESLPDFVALPRLLAQADCITLHVPLTRHGEDATFHLFDNERLSALARRPLLINTARGPVVDNHALRDAIREGKTGGVALDVWENEPNVSGDLMEAVDIATPHIAGYSFDGKVAGVRMIQQALCRHFGMQPAWDPAPLMPPPPVTAIDVGAGPGEHDEDALRRVVRQAYDITADDAALRDRPQDFDRLRAEYPVRREFHNITARLHNVSDSLRQKLAALGFRQG
jgi:erythronate-4-phosphate dehydrogenase